MALGSGKRPVRLRADESGLSRAVLRARRPGALQGWDRRLCPHGRVLAARTCRSLARARIELWLVNDQGEYDDAHRATVFSRRDGRYRFESNRPVGYGGRPPHIHIRVTARGFRTLVTQHYPRGTRRSATFNLVLIRR